MENRVSFIGKSAVGSGYKQTINPTKEEAVERRGESTLRKCIALKLVC